MPDRRRERRGRRPIGRDGHAEILAVLLPHRRHVDDADLGIRRPGVEWRRVHGRVDPVDLLAEPLVDAAEGAVAADLDIDAPLVVDVADGVPVGRTIAVAAGITSGVATGRGGRRGADDDLLQRRGRLLSRIGRRRQQRRRRILGGAG